MSPAAYLALTSALVLALGVAAVLALRRAARRLDERAAVTKILAQRRPVTISVDRV